MLGDFCPLVSIVVPLYNYERYIRDCVRSVLNQTYSNWELIVVDDCSTDNSYKVVSQFKDNRISVLRLNKNGGYSKAKNEGIIVSKGLLITCLDADDMFTKDSLNCRVNALLDNDVSFVHAKAVSVFGDINYKQCLKLKKICRLTPAIHAQTVMVKRWVYKEFGLYDEKMRSRADKEMWCRLFGNNYRNCDKLSKIRRLFIDKDVAYYRLHNKSMHVRRARDPKLQQIFRKLLSQQYRMRVDDGITRDNTRFLDE